MFELQAADVGSRGAYLAFAIALREALARRLSVEPEAMGVAVAQRGGVVGSVYSIFLFDRAVGGAGFAVQAGPLLLEILPEATEILDCKVPGCRTGCPACVLTSDLSEDDAEGLDRMAALEGARRIALMPRRNWSPMRSTSSSAKAWARTGSCSTSQRRSTQQG